MSSSMRCYRRLGHTILLILVVKAMEISKCAKRIRNEGILASVKMDTERRMAFASQFMTLEIFRAGY